jgi:ribosome-associated protein
VIGPLVVRPGIVIPASELRWRFSHSGGPGGQSVNTSDSRVELSFDLLQSSAFTEAQRERAIERLRGRLVDGVITVAASEHRSQLRNREAAMVRLADVLQRAVAPPPAQRRPTRPTRASVRRRLDAKRRRSALKQQRRGTSSE